jgi:hypothetical protein
MTVCEELPSGCQMIWNYFSTSHGKGEMDGVGAIWKRDIQKNKLSLM